MEQPRPEPPLDIRRFLELIDEEALAEAHDEHERNQETRTEFPYPPLTRDQLSTSVFTPEEIAEAMAEAYANHEAFRRTWSYIEEVLDRYFDSTEVMTIVLPEA
jgi:hypothetical protein